MAKIFSLLDYDLARLTADEASALEQAGIDRPEGWLSTEQRHIHRFRLPEGRSIAFVLLPYVERGIYELPLITFRRSQNLIERARAKADMVVGVSPWGFTMEREFAQKATTLPDILLGSGPGSGLNGQIMREEKLLWVRPYSLGKTANILTILRWPEPGLDFKWVKGYTVRLKVESYSGKFQERPDILELLPPTESH